VQVLQQLERLNKLPCLKAKLAKPVDNIESSDLETILAKQSNDQLPKVFWNSIW
jgi:hypothetical protein